MPPFFEFCLQRQLETLYFFRFIFLFGMKSFFLIDGFAFLYRAYYAFPEMRTAEGQNVNAVYGFLRMLLKRLTQRPEYVVIARDAKEKTFRHSLYPEYKATRKKMEEDFTQQIPLIQSLVQELQIPSLMMPGYEADDLLANVIRRFTRQEDLFFTVFTGDKDLRQLLSERVVLMAPDKDQPYHSADFWKEFGFAPAGIVDYLALLGDAADNIKGVTGIGQKKALSLVQEFHTLEGIYEHLDELSPAVKSLLLSGKEDAFYSKRLVQLASIDFNETALEEFAFHFDVDLWLELLCQRYGLSSLKKILLEIKKEAEKPQQLGLF